MNNREWSEKILKRIDPQFKHRWTVYEEVLKEALHSDIIWIDCGCGENKSIKELGSLAKIAVGVDSLSATKKGNFIQADIKNLPFCADFADLITLRFVAEHFQNVSEYMNEIKRVTKKGGKIIILTTNLLSPIIFLPRLLFPYSLKNKIPSRLFKVKEDDVFPAYHKLNSPRIFKKLRNDFVTVKMVFISDLNYTRRWIFILLLIWHKITAIRGLNKFRTNILLVLKKK